MRNRYSLQFIYMETEVREDRRLEVRKQTRGGVSGSCGYMTVSVKSLDIYITLWTKQGSQDSSGDELQLMKVIVIQSGNSNTVWLEFPARTGMGQDSGVYSKAWKEVRKMDTGTEGEAGKAARTNDQIRRHQW